MTKKVLLVYPEIPTTYWSLKHALPFAGYKTLMPPLGILTVAAMLPEEFQCTLVDMNVSELTPDMIKQSDLIMISAMIVQRDSFNDVVKLCNECNVPVAVGGPYATTSYESITGVDYFILNEGEITIPLFIADYLSGNPQKIYTSEEKPDITKTPAPRLDLIDYRLYGTMALQYSRGCPFSCEFCDIIEMFGRVPRTKNPDQFVNEMQLLYNTGYRGPLFIVDDNFIGNKKRVKELLPGIARWQNENNTPYTLYTEASINLAEDDELMDMMIAAGFTMVFVGIETPDSETLAATNKGQNMKHDLLESVQKIQEKGMEVLAGFIVGFDTDRDDIFERQIEFIQKSGIAMAMVGIMMALPKTQLHRRLEAEGRLLHESNGNNGNEISINFIPKMDIDVLFEGYKHVLSEIYTPRNYFKRGYTLVSRIPRSVGSRPLQKSDLRALALSLIRQSASRYGAHYLWFILKTIFTRPWNFALAVNVSIKGYHFFRMTHETIHANEFAHAARQSIHHFEKQMNKILEMGAPVTGKEIETHGHIMKRTVKKKYRKLGSKVRKSSFEEFVQFDKNCDSKIEQWKDRLEEDVNVA